MIIIDDDRSGLESLSQALKLHNHRSKNFTDPEAAITYFRRKPAEIVISDFQLPGKDGIQVLKILKTIHPTVRVVLVTATKNDQVAIEALNRGARAFFQKPIQIEDLVKTLDTLVTEIRLQRKRQFELRELKHQYKQVSEEISHLGKIITKLR